MSMSNTGQSTNSSIKQFTVRVPKPKDERSFHVMKFNANYNIDFGAWTQVRMARENNEKIYAQTPVGDEPKFGAGSAFGKEQKEEARRKKLGFVGRKYRSEDQPWLMRINGKGGKKYKGTREGGVANNCTYYIFTHGNDGEVEAYPIQDWYNFVPIQRYKALDAEEAEEKFAQRGKVLNKWAVMVHRKLKPTDDDELDGEDAAAKKSKGKKGKEFKISDMDDWDDEDELASGSDKEKNDELDSDDDKPKKRGKDTKKKDKKKKKGEEDNEAFEDSDDGDDEGRELDYSSDESSESESEEEKEANVKGVDMDEGLAKMLDSDESSSEDEDKKKKDEDDDDDEKGKKKKKQKSNTNSRENTDDESANGKKKKGSSAAQSRSNTPTQDGDKSENAAKRKALVANILDPSDGASAKKSRLEQFGTSGGASSAGSAGNDAVSEETVRRYLKRRPMTTTELLKKFRSKKTGIENTHLVELLANILKKINPHKQKVKGTTYLSLK